MVKKWLICLLLTWKRDLCRGIVTLTLLQYLTSKYHSDKMCNLIYLSWIGWGLNYRSQINLFRDSIQITWLNSFQWIQMATYAPGHISIKIDWIGLHAVHFRHSGNWTHGMGVTSGSGFEYLYLLGNLQIISQFLYHPNLPYSCPSNSSSILNDPMLLSSSVAHMYDGLCWWMQVTDPRLSVFVTDLSCGWCWSDWKPDMPGPERDFFFFFF